MSRTNLLLLMVVVLPACGSTAPETFAQQACDRACAKIRSCPGNGKLDCHCSQARDDDFARCQNACESLPSCADEYRQCLNACVPPSPTDCNQSCAGCAANWVCFGGATPGVPTQFQFSAICLQRCAVASDCLAGDHCVQDTSVAGRNAGPVCVADPSRATVPTPCGSGVSGCSGPTVCADENTLAPVFYAPARSVCGRELIHCDAGCEGATEDGGIADGGVPGHCR